MRRISTLAAGILAAGILATPGIAQNITNVIDGFDPAGTGGNSYSAGQITNVWMNWFGDAFQSLSWDGSSDAGGNPASGSMEISADFDGSGSIPNQFEVYDGLTGINPPLNAMIYTNFQCDVRFDPSSATVMVGGTPIFGHLEFGIAVGFDQDYFGSIDVPASNTNWVHVSIPLNAVTDTNLTNIADLLIHMYGPYYSPGLSGPTTLWVDNIEFSGYTPVPTNCVVNWTDVHQHIDGFGASSAWNSSLTSAQMDMFYSTNNGIGLSLLRSRIAPDGSTVEGSAMQMAVARGAQVWSTPWSPPVIYKDSGTVNGGDFVSSVSNYQGYANQIAGYVQYVKTNYQVSLYAVSVQNEPNISTTYESCLWTAQQIHDFVPYLYNALSNYGVGSTKILLPEYSSWDFSIASATLADPVTSNMVGVLACHDYDYTVSPVNSGSKELWESEVSAGSTFDGSMSDALYWGEKIHDFMTVAQANAWHYWWLVSLANDNGGLTDGSGNPAKRMYVLGNYSRFVRPGYYRIGVSNNAPTLVSAFKDAASGNFAIVAINPFPGDYVQTFNLAGFGTPVVTPWVTSASLSLASQPTIAVSNSVFAYDLPAMSVVTFTGQAGPIAPTIAVQMLGVPGAHHSLVSINGPAGGNYTIWSSTDLVHWQSLATINLAATPTKWLDPTLAVATRYYRVSLAQ